MKPFMLIIMIVTLFISPPVSGQVVMTHFTDGNNINAIACDGDYIWCATQGGAVRWDRRDGSYVKYTPEDGLVDMRVNSVAIDADHVVWFGANNLGVSSFDGSSWTTFKDDDIIAEKFILDIVVDNENVKWFGTANGIFSFDGTTWCSYLTDNQSPYGYVYALAVDAHNVLWAATNVGLACFDGETWTTPVEDERFPEDRIYHIAIDPITDTKWFIGSNGLYSLNGDSLSTFDSNKETCLAIDNNGIRWTGTNHGIMGMDNNVPVQFLPAGDRSLQHIHAVAISSDNVKWFGTENGLLCYDGSDWTTFRINDPHYYYNPTLFAVDNSNKKWFAAENHIFSYDGTDWTTHINTTNSFWDPNVITMGPDDTIWASDGGNLLHYEGTDWRYYGSPPIKASSVSALDIDDAGVVWVGYRSCNTAIYSFDGAVWRAHVFDSGNEWRIMSIVIDREQVIWVITGRGFYFSADGETWGHESCTGPLAVGQNSVTWVEYNSDELRSFDGEKWTTHTKEKSFTSYTLAVDNHNVLWIGTHDGELVRYDGTSWQYYDMFIGRFFHWIVADAENIKWIGTELGITRLDDSAIPVRVEHQNVPSRFSITGNYPNPFNPVTAIEFSLEMDTDVSLDVYSITGQRIRTLAEERFQAGSHAVVWDGNVESGAPAGSGVYFCRLRAGGRTSVHRMMLVR